MTDNGSGNQSKPKSGRPHAPVQCSFHFTAFHSREGQKATNQQLENGNWSTLFLGGFVSVPYVAWNGQPGCRIVLPKFWLQIPFT
jgi:hypothetical protein